MAALIFMEIAYSNRWRSGTRDAAKCKSSETSLATMVPLPALPGNHLRWVKHDGLCLLDPIKFFLA